MQSTRGRPGEGGPLASVVERLRESDGLKLARSLWVRRGAAVASVFVLWLILDRTLDRGIPLGIIVQGLVFGSLYSLTAVGLVLIYRANRVVNFAQAELGGIAAVVAIQVVIQFAWNYFLAMSIGLVGAALLGAGIYLFIIRRFRNAPRLILAVATIGIAQILAGLSLVTSILFGEQPAGRKFEVPFKIHFTIFPQLFRGDDMLAMIVVPAVMIALALFFRYTDYGIAIRAAAENGDRANLLGIPILYLHVAVWAMAGLLSALGMMLRVSILGFSSFASVTQAGNALLLRTLAAGVIARMEKIPRTVVAALGLGIFEASASWTFSNTDIVDAFLVVFILVALLLQRGFFSRAGEAGMSTWRSVREVRPIPAELRDLPEVRRGIWGLSAVLLAFVLTLPSWMDTAQLNVVGLIYIYSIVAVSLVILTGWAGHISLGQFALVGFGAAATAVLYGRHHWDYFAAMAVGVVLSALIALVIGLPALRIRGPFLAVTTLAFAVTAGNYFLVDHYFPWFIQDFFARPSLWDGRVNLESETQMYYMALIGLAFALFAAWNLRRSRSGRAMVAVRDNQLAAESVSINSTRVKLMAFVISGAMAGFAGAIYAVNQRGIFSGSFKADVSIRLFSMVVIGGLGSLPGAILGAAYVRSAEAFLSGGWALIASGTGILLLLMFLPEGLGGLMYAARDGLLRRVARRRGIVVPSLLADVRQEQELVDVDLSGVLSGNGLGAGRRTGSGRR